MTPPARPLGLRRERSPRSSRKTTRLDPLPASMRDPERLEQILNELPVLESRRDTVKAQAYFLWSCATLVGFPRDTIPTTTKQAEGELLVLRKKVSGLRLHVGKMSMTALEAMDADTRAVLAYLVQMEKATLRGLERLRAQPAIKVRGRPRMRRAEHIATVAARVFERLTGMSAAPSVNSQTNAAYGPFLVFLKDVFVACGVAASAEAQAKAARRKRRPPRSDGAKEKLRKKLELTPFDAVAELAVRTCSRSKTAVRSTS